MWIISIIAFSIITVAGSIATWISYHHDYEDSSDHCFFTWTLAIATIIIPLFLGVGLSVSSGIEDSTAIPQQKHIIRLKKYNLKHYQQAMEFDEHDESNERKSATHLKFSLKGDYSESKDNSTWRSNYNKWYQNKCWIRYYQVAIQYEKHPLSHIGDAYYLSSSRPGDFAPERR